MTIKNRVEKLEQHARDIELDNRVELVLPWPGQEPIRMMVPPRTIEMINKAYGPEAQRLRHESSRRE